MLCANLSPTVIRRVSKRVRCSNAFAVRLLDLLEPFPVFHEFGNPTRVVAQLPTEDGAVHCFPLGSDEFVGRVLVMFDDQYGELPSLADVKLVSKFIAARAQQAKDPRYFFLRIGGSGLPVYLDLADGTGRAVEIDASGWRIVDHPSVIFLQPPGMLPLPHPVPGTGNIDLLKKFLKVAPKQWPLIPAWLVNIFRIFGPHVILANIAQHGVGKTLGSTCLRQIVDPNIAPLRAEPRSERDLVIASSKSIIAAFDNISYVSDPMSNAFCRLTTTGGFSTRKLYTDDGEFVLNACRPVLINGISDFIVQPDLQSRTIQINQLPLTDAERKDVRQLNEEFRQDHPKILAAVLDGVHLALTNWNRCTLERSTRNADFTRFAMAAAPAFGLSGVDVFEALSLNERRFDEDVLEKSPVAAAICKMVVGEHRPFEGTVSQLLHDLFEGQDEDTPFFCQKISQMHPTVLSKELKKLVPVLERLGVRVEFPPRKPRHRGVKLSPIPCR